MKTASNIPKKSSTFDSQDNLPTLAFDDVMDDQPTLPFDSTPLKKSKIMMEKGMEEDDEFQTTQPFEMKMPPKSEAQQEKVSED